jgi:hypothetical protein
MNFIVFTVILFNIESYFKKPENILVLLTFVGTTILSVLISKLNSQYARSEFYILNQIQLFLLVPLLITDAPRNFKEFCADQGAASLAMKFIPFLELIIESTVGKFLDWPQNDSYESNIGLDPDWSLDNFIQLFATYFILMLNYAAFLILYK